MNNDNDKNPNNINFGEQLHELKSEFRDQVAFFLAVDLSRKTNFKWQTKSPLTDIIVCSDEEPSIAIAIQHLNTSPSELVVCIHHTPKNENYENHLFTVNANAVSSKVAQEIVENSHVKKLLGLQKTS